MLSGYYTIASGVLTRQREIDVVGNNLVNAQTNGYRADRLIISPFQQELLTRQEAYQNQTLEQGRTSTAAVVDSVVTLYHSGAIKSTGRALDLAINGPGFFNVQGENGQIYLTRNGGFDLDEEGYLILPGYGRVLGDDGPLQLGASDEFTIGQVGEIYNERGRRIDGIRITEPPENVQLEKLANGMFQFPQGVTAQLAGGYTLVQQSLELSNVDYNQELTYLLEAQRAFQACSSALQIADEMNQKAATQIAAV